MTLLVRLDAESFKYPRHLLEECSSGLLLFCSGRMGAADGHWFRDVGLTDVTAVDWDEETLEPYRAAFPEEWDYVHSDAFEWAAHFATRRWDIVSADPPSQYADRTATRETLGLWCRLATKFVTATVMTTDVDVPAGWDILDLIERASYDDGRVYHWLVLGRA